MNNLEISIRCQTWSKRIVSNSWIISFSSRFLRIEAPGIVPPCGCGSGKPSTYTCILAVEMLQLKITVKSKDKVSLLAPDENWLQGSQRELCLEHSLLPGHMECTWNQELNCESGPSTLNMTCNMSSSVFMSTNYLLQSLKLGPTTTTMIKDLSQSL